MMQSPVRKLYKDLVEERCEEIRDKLSKVLPDVPPTYEEECEELKQQVEQALRKYEELLLQSLDDC